MSLNESLQLFQTNISKASDYVTIAYDLDDDGNERYSSDQKDFIVSSAFLKMFICWEEFLESAFIKYLLGEPSITGDFVVAYASPRDNAHAQSMIIGTQRYVDWANHEIVKRLSTLFFENGGPISAAIASITLDLLDLRGIRNAAAHMSSTTQRQLDVIASRKLKQPISNCSVSDYITRLSPDDSTKTIMQSYQLLLEISAENIARNNT